MTLCLSRSSVKKWRQSIGYRILWWTLLVVNVALLCLLIPVFPISSSTNYTCLHCRAHKHEQRILYIPWAKVTDTVFSPWFRAHYPAHEHVWGWSGGSELYSIAGHMGNVCGKRHPIYGISPGEELALAERVPEEFRDFYRTMVSSDRAEQEKAVQTALARLIERR